MEVLIMEIIEILGIASVPAITAICYLIGMLSKHIEVIPDKFIPDICGISGALLGVLAMHVMPEFPATEIITALAVGGASGLAATGVHQAVSQIRKNKNPEI